MSALVVNLEVRNYDGEVVTVLGPVPWPWPLPRREDVVTFGSPRQFAEVLWSRYDLGDEQVSIVCERMSGRP